MVNVSRETSEKVNAFVEILSLWNRKINLVSPYDMEHLQKRHIDDSIYLCNLLPEIYHNIVDLGSGSGFPGIIIAIYKSVKYSRTNVTLVDSDERKCIFLEEVVRKLGLDCKVINKRVEHLRSIQTDCITSRALAPLPKLLEYTSNILTKNGACYFIKGKNIDNEIKEAQKKFIFEYEIICSQRAGNTVLKVQRICNVNC